AGDAAIPRQVRHPHHSGGDALEQWLAARGAGHPQHHPSRCRAATPGFRGSAAGQPRGLSLRRRHLPCNARCARGPAAQRTPDGDGLMYVAVKGGEAAISAAHELLARERRGDARVPEISTDQIREQLTLAVHRVMCEGSLYDPDLAALAVKQARGDLIEAIFLLRAYRTTLPRLGYSEPVDTGTMYIRRRISATYKDLPGGQILGPTFDYTHRLLEPTPDVARGPLTPTAIAAPDEPTPRVTALLD